MVEAAGSEFEDEASDNDEEEEDSGRGMTVTITGRLVIGEEISPSIDVVDGGCEGHVTVVVGARKSVEEVVVGAIGTGTGSNAGAKVLMAVVGGKVRIPSGRTPLGGSDVVTGNSTVDVVGIEPTDTLVAVLSTLLDVMIVITGIGPRE